MQRSSWRGTWLLLSFILLLGLVFYGPTNNWSWDPSYYYAQIRSPLIEGDLDWRPETIPFNGIYYYTANGLQESLWPVGPGLLWAPFFWVAHALTLCLYPAQANGFTPHYIALVSAGSALYGLFGIAVVYRIGREYGSRYLAGASALLTLLATPMFFYIFRQPIMAHSTNLLAAALLVWLCILFERGRLSLSRSGLVFGVLVGMNALLRWSSILLAILPAGLLLFRLWDAARTKDQQTLKSVVIQILILAGVALVTFSPQFSEWYRLHNRWVYIPPQGFNLESFQTNLVKLVLDTNRGILFWLPFAVLGFAGLFRLRERRLAILSLVYLACFYLLLATRLDWFGGGGFGARYFVEALPLAALGYAALFAPLEQKPYGRALIGLLSVGLAFHQVALMIAIEQAPVLLWLTLKRYFRGKAIGLRFQLRSLWGVLTNPGLLFAYRPVVTDDRQTILVSLFSGKRELAIFIIPFAGVILLPLVVFVEKGFERLRQPVLLTALPALTALYCLGWFFFFLFL